MSEGLAAALRILLLILKILGWTVGGILALVILIVLIVLFVPFRYRVKAAGRMPDVTAQGKVTWLLHIVSVAVSFDPENKLDYGARLFGIKVFPKKEKPDQAAKEAADPDGDGGAPPPEDTAPEGTEQVSPGQEPAAAGSAETVQTDEGGAATEQPQAVTTDDGPEDAVYAADDDVIDPDDLDDGPELSEKEKKRQEKAAAKEAKRAEKAEKASEEKPDLEERIEAIKEKISGIFDKIRTGTDFVNDPDNRYAFRLIKTRLFAMLRHFRPRKLTGELLIGLEDPSTTGKILGAFYMLYPLYAKHFSLQGEFQEEIIEGDIYMRGHIRLIHPVYMAIRLFCNRTIRSWLKKK